jgi:DNA-binding NarL/FixJ family response regulator
VIRVLLADGQALFRESLRLLLELDPGLTCVGAAADGPAAVTLARQARPDVVVTDVRLPRLEAAVPALRHAQPAARLLVLTAVDDEEDFQAAMRAGASGFLLKDVRREQLTGAIRGVAAGEVLLHPALTRRLLDRFVREPAARPPQLPAALTHREAEVLRLLSRGLSNAEIAAELFVGEATVKTHVARVLAKLGVRDRLQAVVAAYEYGLVRARTAAPRLHVA